MVERNYDEDTKTLTISGTGDMKSYSYPEFVAMHEYVIEKVIIGDGVTSIAKEAFIGCGNLESVTIPDSVTDIGSYAFSYCSGISQINIPKNVTGIGNYAFYECRKLSSAAIPISVRSIGRKAFFGCNCLNTVIFYNFPGAKQLKLTGGSDVPLSEQIDMIINKNYGVRMDPEVKYDILRQLLGLNPDEEELVAYIKTNIIQMMHFAIDRNDAETVNNICESKKFLTGRNIVPITDYAINNTQQGGSIEIQAVLMNCKNEHFNKNTKDKFIL